jgi:hypothetical protein
MKAMKNVVHLGILGVWALAGVLFTLRQLVVLSGFLHVALFWGWFAALAALTSWLVAKFDTPVGALGTHGASLLVMQALPAVLPFALVRLGLDLLWGRGLPF